VGDPDLSAARRAAFVDRDGDTDVRAGCHTSLVEHEGSAHKGCEHAHPDAVLADLGAAAAFLARYASGS
jgi:hypothetical protein